MDIKIGSKYRKLLFFERSPPRGGTLRDSGRDTLAPAAGYICGGTLRDSGRDTLARAAGYMWGGTLRDAGGDSLAPAAGYIWGGTLRDTGRETLAPAAGYMWGNVLSFASVVLMCRLYLSRRGGRKEEESGSLFEI